MEYKKKHVDWNDYTTNIEGKQHDLTSAADKVDTIIFADCIYNEECANISLSQTISHLLNPGGSVIGVLPGFRVGLNLFEKRMKQNNFTLINIPIIVGREENRGGGACSGEGWKAY